LETQTPVKEKVSQQPIRLEAMLASQQLKLKIEEIQQRLKFNEELFKVIFIKTFTILLQIKNFFL